MNEVNANREKEFISLPTLLLPFHPNKFHSNFVSESGSERKIIFWYKK